MLTEVNKLKESFASLEKNFKEIRAANPVDQTSPDNNDSINRIYDTIYSMISNVHNRISYLASDMGDYCNAHSKGHLPPIQGAGKMESCLRALGMDADYNVSKPTVYASRTGKTIIAEYKKPVVK